MYIMSAISPGIVAVFTAFNLINNICPVFVFVPVHDTLHWSLAVICHPGLLAAAAGGSSSSSSGGGAAAGAAGGGDSDVPKQAMIIHLDSMAGERWWRAAAAAAAASPAGLCMQPPWLREGTSATSARH